MAKWIYQVARATRSVPDDPKSEPMFELPEVFHVVEISHIALWEAEPDGDPGYQYFLGYLTPVKK
jgi:hypothetical protein